MVNIEDVWKLYDELLPWEKEDFYDELQAQMGSEKEEQGITNMDIEEFIWSVGEYDILNKIDRANIVDYVLEWGMEGDIISEMDTESLVEYLNRNCPSVIEKIRGDYNKAKEE